MLIEGLAHPYMRTHRASEVHNGKVLFAEAGNEAPSALIATAVWDRVQEVYADPAPAVGEVVDFELGVAHGMWNTVPDTLGGLWDGVKLVGRLARDYNQISIAHRLLTGGAYLTVEDAQRFKTGVEVFKTVARVVLEIEQDRRAFLAAALTGDLAEINALGEEYRVAFEYAAEMLDALWGEFLGLPAYDKGKIAGRVIGEVVLTGERDDNRLMTRSTYEHGYRADGFAHATYLEVPGMGRDIPDAEWFEKGIAALEARE